MGDITFTFIVICFYIFVVGVLLLDHLVHKKTIKEKKIMNEDRTEG